MTGPLDVRSLDDLPAIEDRSVLVRATLELPLASGGESPVAALRLNRLAETVRALRERGASITVCGDAHLSGGEAPSTSDRSLVSELGGLDASVAAPDHGSVEDAEVLDGLIREHDAFVNDSFQWSYLALPSLVVPPARLPAAAGRSLEADLRVASAVMKAEARPFVAVLGGANSLLRLHGLQGLALRADAVLVGGALSLPLLEAVGKIPNRGTPDWFLAECRGVIGLAERVGHHIQLPCDVVIRRPGGELDVIDSSEARDGDVVDVGPTTAKRFAELVHGSERVVWTGALGQVEDRSAAAGTITVARGLNQAASATSVLGGDSLVTLLDSEDLLSPDMGLITATDSLLELLKNGDLPALAVLRG